MKKTDSLPSLPTGRFEGTKKTILMKKTTLIVILTSCIISTHLCAQSVTGNNITSEQKKHLTPENYKLWEHIISGTISDNGEWYTYFKRHKNTSPLFVVSTNSTLKYEIPYGGIHQFSTGSNWIACVDREKDMRLLNLKDGRMQLISNVIKFEFSPDGNYLIYLKNERIDTQSSSSIYILNLKSGKINTIDGITDYLLNPVSNHLAYILDRENEKAVELMTLGEITPTRIIQNALYSCKSLVWNVEGTSLAFLQEQPEITEIQNTHKVYCYKTITGKPTLYSLNSTTDDFIFSGRNIISSILKFAPKESALYFKVHGSRDMFKPTNNGESGEVEVWRASDKELYPERNINQQNKVYGAKLVSWYPETGKTILLETNRLPKAIVSNNGKYMLSHNPLLYEPSHAQTGRKDLYLTDLETGETSLFLEKYGGKVFISPNSKYINYFKDKHWWIYDLEKKTHTNITKQLIAEWHKNFPKHPHKYAERPFGIAGWTKDDKQLIVYDKYDVWLISPIGKAQKITQGEVSQIRYRIYSSRDLYKDEVKQFLVPTAQWFSNVAEEFDLSKGLIFETRGENKASGYSIWYPGKKTKVLVYKDMEVSDLRKAKNKEAYTYVEQSFSISPRLRYLENDKSNSKILKESNLQQKKFHWGHSELIRYKGPNGEDLLGALFYPANYKQGKKYPMIVEIYERLSGSLHKYQNPSEYMRERLNRTNYTTAGYFMFHPDISVTFNEVGRSIVRSVEAGVKAVISKGIVKEDYIGLNGHSFGGYGTNFIITQSNLFAAAVSGAGISDLVSSYHGFHNPFRNAGSNMLRFEDWQYSIKGSFYENPEAYIRNSPIHHAVNINTPLLLWTGKKDGSVDFRQSFEMYFGLRRLNKTCELIVYPNEGHSISNPKNQADLTRRIKAWFDTYLKPDQALKNDPVDHFSEGARRRGGNNN